MKTAEKMESEGQEIIKLNIGNPAPWGFLAPEEILNDVIRNIPNSQGYSDSKGIYSARKAIMQYYQSIGVNGVDVDQIYIGNGVSELITMSTQALLEDNDEVLVPSPDYPLWTASTSLCGAKPVHYLCDEADGWQPDEKDIRSKITEKTKTCSHDRSVRFTVDTAPPRYVYHDLLECSIAHTLTHLCLPNNARVIHKGGTYRCVYRVAPV